MVKQYVGARYVPKFASPVEWAADTSYEALTIVTYNNSSYTSKIPVPATVGNPADNPDYWALTGNYNAQVEQYRRETETVKINYSKCFNTAANMIADTSLTEGMIVKTLGYNKIADNGGAFYKIYNTKEQNSEHYENLSNGKYALLIPNGYITPEMFGAVADGVSDAREGIIEAIEYASLHGLDLNLSEGTYLLDPNQTLDIGIPITSSCTIIGKGRGKTIIKVSGNYPGSMHIFHIMNTNNVTIKDLTIDGGIDEEDPVFPSSKYCHGIRLGNCTDINLLSLEIKNTSGYGIGQQENSSQNVTIDNVIIKNTGRDGIDLKNFNSTNKDFTFNNIYVSNFGIGPNSASDFYTGIDIRCDGANISNIYIENVTGVNSGLRMKATNATQGTGGKNASVSNVQIYGDNSNNTVGEGLAINNTGVKISNVYVKNMAIGVRITDTDNSLSNVIVDGCKKQGFRIDADGNMLTNCAVQNMTDENMIAGIDIRLGSQYFSNFRMKNVTTGFEIYSSATAVKISGIEMVDITTPFKGKSEKIEIDNAYGNVINTQPIEVSVGYGKSVTYNLDFMTVGYKAYKTLFVGHNMFPNICGLYLITNTNVIPIINASGLSVSISSGTLTITHNGTGGTAKGVIY